MSDPTSHLGLLIIDLQDSFLKTLPNADELLARTQFSINAAALFGCAIAVTEQIPQKLGSTTKSILDTLPPSTPCFEKNTFSALEAQGINRWIEANQIEHILVAGIETPICIYQTAVQAISSEIGVTILSDCIGERRPQDRKAILAQLSQMGAHILPSESIFYSLLSSAEHPNFREFTKLVRDANAPS